MINNNKCETLLDVLNLCQNEHSYRTGYVYLSPALEITSTCTYLELTNKAKAIAYKLQSKGIKKGDRALLVYEPTIEFLYAFMACQYAGVIAIPCYPPANKKLIEKISSIISTAEPNIILSTVEIKNKIRRLKFFKTIYNIPGIKKILPAIKQQIQQLMQWDFDKFNWMTTDNINAGLHKKFSSIEILPDDISFLQFTSGSTSTPKGVIVRHRNIIHNVGAASHAININKNDKIVTWLPPYHDMGLIGGLLTPLCNQIPAYVMSPIDFIKNVPIWMKAISKFQGTISAAPNFAYALCARKISDNAICEFDLSTWRAALNGAEPIRQETMEVFKNKFAPCGFNESAFFPCYGLAESTLFVSGRFGIATQSETSSNKKLISCGELGQDFEAIIINPETGIVLENGFIGEVCIHSPSVTTGYWNSQTNNHCFINNKFLKTGDLGLISDNQLFITGRIKDSIIINGLNYYPQDIEETVIKNSLENVINECVAFGITDENEEKLALIIEVSQSTHDHYNQFISHIRKNILLEHQLHAYNIYLVERKSILKTTSGKLQRYANKAALNNNQFNILHKA